MPIPIQTEFAPMGGQGYALLEDNFIRGGLRVVPNEAALSELHPSLMKAGMIAVLQYANDEGVVQSFQLGDDLQTWTPAFIGRTGPKGDQGLRGEKGDKGDPGPRGMQGERGVQGERGPIGERGVAGPIGQTGLTGDRGAKGDPGPKGDQGVQGVQGDPGPKGDVGSQGLRGDTGPKGEKGDPGPKGDKGDQGNIGPKGDQGIQGNVGPVGPAGGPGAKGDPGPKGDQGAPFTPNGKWAGGAWRKDQVVYDLNANGTYSFYVALSDVNSNTPPRSDSTNWREVPMFPDDFYNTIAGDLSYDLGTYGNSVMEGTVLFSHDTVREIMIPAGFAGTVARVDTAVTTAAGVDVMIGGVKRATLQFAAGGTVATVTGAPTSALTVAAGTPIRFVGGVNATLSGVTMTVKATRTVPARV